MVKKIAVVGATGIAGIETLKILSQRKFPVDDIVVLASSKSVGKEIDFDNKKLIIQNLETYNWKGTDIAFFAVSGNLSDVYGKKATESGCIVIDKSSFYRMDNEVPLVIPEVNPQDISLYKNKNIIASPNCTTTQMLVALKPLHDFAKIKRIVVSSYQATSGAGKEAQEELYNATKEYYKNNIAPNPINFKKSIVFNVIPQIDSPSIDDYSGEEEKMIKETKKILGKDIEITATCARVPVLNCHSESVNVEFENKISPDKARELLNNFNGVKVVDDFKNDIFATAFEYSGTNEVYVSRIRKDTSIENGLNLWIVADNIRKGAALNAVQIAEILIEKYLTPSFNLI
jgi:aspartate-semialdehyde dehydrogenase